ncbi:hypothetical protein BKA67DRAFT_661130 [Truncatella angustata]|uniref:Rhodopsin domain-containing protein n=1 Tax=Truncatella angustata TaxID=152316 RepID=A0A9P8UHR9_9PEZI|nr:uncharacterized protein BKA67DRAFT_661130 [Truncatella angustata]KAH6652388.1 hypothetical protein BKA67DRAFT_661130 [Truncatella angustata]
MAFKIFNDPIEGALFVLILVCTPIVVLVTTLRVVTSLKNHRTLSTEDYLAVLASLINLAYNALEMWTITVMNGVPVLSITKLPYPTLVKILKVGYFIDFMFPLNQTFSKLSLLLLYYRIFSINKTFSTMVFVVAAIQTCWGISMFFARVFACTPIYHFWDRLAPGTCISGNGLLVGPEIVNSLLDFVMVGMAIWIVQKLNMSTKYKRKLSILFALGCITGIIGFVKIGVAYDSIGNNGIDAVWDVLQMCASNICCCIPIYKVLLPKTNVLKSLGSKLFSKSSWKSSTSSNMGNSSHVQQQWVHLDESSMHELAGVRGSNF